MLVAGHVLGGHFDAEPHPHAAHEAEVGLHDGDFEDLRVGEAGVPQRGVFSCVRFAAASLTRTEGVATHGSPPE